MSANMAPKMRRQLVSRTLPFLLGALLLTTFQPGPAHALEPHLRIKGLFRTERDVTVKCLECHRDQAGEIRRSSHWSWKRQRNINGKQTWFGKKDSLTGFGIDVGSNPERCMACHISIPPHDINLETAGPDMVNCLVCHDTTNTYRPGAPPEKIAGLDLLSLARSAGIPSIRNCTACHFADCGLAGTDHTAAPGQKDVHMAREGFRCQTCHLRSGHTLSRATGTEQTGCVTCHTDAPHTLTELNSHGRTIACQTCHIPVYGASSPTLISWNWVMAGKTAPLFRKEPDGTNTTLFNRNGVRTGTNLIPAYLWDDGSDIIYTRGKRVRPESLTILQKPADRGAASKIAPFKRVYATQLYDAKYRYLISPVLAAEGPELFPASGWNEIAATGMKAIVLPYSGQYGFVPTVSFKRINHGVAPAENALDCLECHGASGRMRWDRLGYGGDPMHSK